MTRRDFVQAGLGLGLASATGAALSQGADVTRIVVGFPPGGTVDAVARQVADKLQGLPGIRRAVIVDNRPGGGGQLGVTAVKGAAPDGGTLLLSPMSILGVYPHTYSKVPYDPFADLVPLGNAVSYDYALAVGPAVPASVTTIPQLMDWYKAHPGKANFGTAATGSTLHFLGMLLGAEAGVPLTHVGYRGAAGLVVDLANGVLPAASATVGTWLSLAKAGKCRILMTSGAQRSPFTPNVPTLAEQGYKDLVFSEWYAFFLPARTPAAVVQELNGSLRKALAAPGMAEAFARSGLVATPSGPEELGAMLRRDHERWGGIVRRFGFTAES